MTEHSFVRCEAIKTSYRQTKDGMVISFAIHPNDLPPELALAPVGTRVLLAVAEIVDGAPEPVLETPPPSVAKSPDPVKSAKAKETFRSLSPWQKDVTRAALLCNDADFRRFLRLQHGNAQDQDTPAVAAETIRAALGISSRSEIGTDARANAEWNKLVTEYMVWSGQLPEMR